MYSARPLTITLLLFVSVPLTAAPIFAQPSGEVIGCITDARNQRLPRVTIVVRTTGFQETLQADAEGCYHVKALPANTYRVTVVLLGFDNETRDNLRIGPGDVVRVDFQMRISTICECPTRTTLLERWQNTSSVVHLHWISAIAEHRRR